MVTFTGWLKEQEGREGDPVGWFAQFWRDLDGKPRLSALPSVTKHLEDRNLFQLTPGLTEAHDAAMAEYRRLREGVVRSVAASEGVQLPETGPAGQAVQRAADAGLAAAQLHQGGITSPPGMSAGIIQPQQAHVMSRDELAAGAREEKTAIQRIEAKLDAVMAALGIYVNQDGSLDLGGGMIDFSEPAQLPWAEWHQQAVRYALAHGPDWDREEA